MSKTALKQHMKSKQEFLIRRGKATVSELDYRLHMVYNERVAKPRMWWINKKNFEDRFPKVKGDVISC